MMRSAPPVPAPDGTETRSIRVRILERDVQVGCRSGDEEDLLRAASYVDRSMRELRRRKPSSSTEKIAVVTAINAAHELLLMRDRESGSEVRDEAPAADTALAADAAPEPASPVSPPVSASGMPRGPISSAASERAPAETSQDEAGVVASRLRELNDEVEAMLASREDD